MVRLHTSSSLFHSSQATHSSLSTRRRHALLASTVAITIAAGAVFIGSYKQFNLEQYHTSALSGAGWIKELKNGHPDWMRHNLGIQAHGFAKLVSELCKEGGLKPR
ncbi:hypothetical protein C8R42DRAFT_576025 [Lentinula raphanica]|nr:hypothetical protein C8R42DRAFT_576025 [Lentinula raphanica]